MNNLEQLIDKQKEFQRGLGWPIDSVSESDRNELSERYIFKMIEEAVELRREFPSVMNPWTKHQKSASLARVKEEYCDVLMFLINFAIVWKFTPEEIMEQLSATQKNNFKKIKERKMSILNNDILKIPNRISGIGDGNLSPKYVFVGQNPGKNITQGYRFWSNDEDGSSKILLPILENLGITRDVCYFTNVVKCTTVDNKEPDEELTQFYLEFLEKELVILGFNNPDMMVIAMGKWTENILNSAVSGYSIHSIPHPATVLYGTYTPVTYQDKLEEILK